MKAGLSYLRLAMQTGKPVPGHAAAEQPYSKGEVGIPGDSNPALRGRTRTVQIEDLKRRALRTASRFSRRISDHRTTKSEMLRSGSLADLPGVSGAAAPRL